MRLFIAVDLPEALRDEVGRGMGRLKRDLPDARWVRPESMHLTLKFLGERAPEFVDELDRTCEAAAAGLQPVEVLPGGGGFFPHERRPRVAWVGGRAEGMERWAEAIDDACSELAIEREARPFAFHLTLARLERPWPPRAAESFLIAVGKWRLEPFAAREIVLFQSQLRPSGAVYTALRRWPVGGA